MNMHLIGRNDLASATCGNCDWHGTVGQTSDRIHKWEERVDLDNNGQAITPPCGECPSCGALAYEGPTYPVEAFIQLIDDTRMPSYAPQDEGNDPLELYSAFVSRNRQELEDDIEDTIRLAEGAEESLLDENVEACTVHADGSITIGPRTITMAQIYEQFGMDMPSKVRG
jgi:hypothetical protein